MPAKTKGVPFHFGKSMVTDVAAYILYSLQELEMLWAAIFCHMCHFGLLMHAGALDENGNHQTKSKTEAMFIPACPMTQEDIDAATTDIVFGSTQYVPFTQEFQYLGSRVTTDLKDVTNINNQLRQAKGQAAALNLGHSMWNSTDEYLPSTTPPFAESSESTCTMLQNIRSRTNTSVITSPSPIQLTLYKNANSIYLANLPAWIQLTSLASFSLPGFATHDALVDSTTHYKTHTWRHFSIFSQISQTMAPSIHGCPLRRTMNSGKHSGLNG
jgi:hypothetical protein